MCEDSNKNIVNKFKDYCIFCKPLKVYQYCQKVSQWFVLTLGLLCPLYLLLTHFLQLCKCGIIIIIFVLFSFDRTLNKICYFHVLAWPVQNQCLKSISHSSTNLLKKILLLMALQSLEICMPLGDFVVWILGKN